MKPSAIPYRGAGNLLGFEVETSCPTCGHDVDHIGPCPKGCPACTPVAVTRIGTNVVYDYGTEERAQTAFDRIP